jgi:hypothetical protein
MIIKVPDNNKENNIKTSWLQERINNNDIGVGERIIMGDRPVTCVDVDINEDGKLQWTFGFDIIFAYGSHDQIRSILDCIYSLGNLNREVIFTPNELQYIDSIFVPSESQMFGENIYGDSNEKQFRWYKEQGRYKRIKGNKDGDPEWYWLSDRCKNNSTYCCYVSDYGNASGTGASHTSIGVPIYFTMHRREK